MDVSIIIALILVCAIVGALWVLQKSKPKDERKRREDELQETVNNEDDDNVVRGNPRGVTRRGLARMANTARNRNQETANNNNNVLDEPEETEKIADEPKKRVGAKKMAKLQMKEERKQYRAAEEEAREQRKKKEEQETEAQKKQAVEREALEKEQEAEEERKRIEKEKKEQEEYQEWKKMMQVETVGTGEDERKQKEAKIDDIIAFLKNQKVTLLEDVAAEFAMKTLEIVELIERLEKEGKISGVIDDRGKFIHITKEELSKVAAFINRRGRASIEDIVRESNKLIQLNQPPATKSS